MNRFDSRTEALTTSTTEAMQLIARLESQTIGLKIECQEDLSRLETILHN